MQALSPIYCSVCEHKCSPKAEACPECAHPLKAPISAPVPKTPIEQLAAVQSNPRPQVVVRPAPLVQTIERTGKKWKAGLLVSTVMLLVCISGCLICVQFTDGVEASGASVMVVIFMLGAAASFAGYVWCRIGAWWHHG